MYKIPITNSPNQTIRCVTPVNGKNINFQLILNYNNEAKYWSLSLKNALTQEEYFTGIPLLSSTFDFSNILKQFGYKNIGIILVVPMNFTEASMPNNEDLGTGYILVWGDND